MRTPPRACWWMLLFVALLASGCSEQSQEFAAEPVAQTAQGAERLQHCDQDRPQHGLGLDQDCADDVERRQAEKHGQYHENERVAEDACGRRPDQSHEGKTPGE